MLAGQRGIIAAGWGDLRLDHLDCQPDVRQLLQFCRKHVLFVTSANHELLFPQCSIIVHHGGIGTTTAGLRSGPCSTSTRCTRVVHLPHFYQPLPPCQVFPTS